MLSAISCPGLKKCAQKLDDVPKIEEALALPKLRKVSVVPKEEPVKKEVKKTKVKVPKAKKYEELPEIPDYERPQLEVYEESDFNQSKAGEKQIIRPTAQSQHGTEHTQSPEPEPIKNGIKVFSLFALPNRPLSISTQLLFEKRPENAILRLYFVANIFLSLFFVLNRLCLFVYATN